MTAQMAFNVLSKSTEKGNYEDFLKTIENVFSTLKDRINKKDLDDILSRKVVLTTKLIKHKQRPEAFTKAYVIEPLIEFLGYEKIGRVSETETARVKTADYKLCVKDDLILVEAEPLNSDLDAESRGISQVEEWLYHRTTDTYYGIATNGFEWALLKFDDTIKEVKTLMRINLLPIFRLKFGAPTLDLDTENIFQNFYTTFAFPNILSALKEIDAMLVEKKEEISKHFYDNYVELVFGIKRAPGNKIRQCDYFFLKAIEHPVEATDEDVKKFAVDFMNRVIFIKFLEDKKLVQKNLLRRLWSLYVSQKPPLSFYKAYLTPLFYNVLDTPVSKREKSTKDVFLFQSIPYLNGSLFRENGGNEGKYNIENDIIEKLIKFIENYDFVLHITTNGGTIVNNVRALDPSILGYVFERTINFLTGEGIDRKKSLGAYYTPDKVTTSISKNTIYPILLERIKKYLKEKGWKEPDLRFDDLEKFLTYPPFKNINYWREILKNIVDKITILDPACGSGHFLTSAQNELLYIKERIYHLLGEKTEKYHLKKEIISNNLFGVDIEGAAVEITKLRMWLSLIEDIKPEEEKEIETLPNIEFNIREGNSLIGWLTEDLREKSLETIYDETTKSIIKGMKLKYEDAQEKYRTIENAEKLLKEEFPRVEKYVEAYSLLRGIYLPEKGHTAVLLSDLLEKIREKIYFVVTADYTATIQQKYDVKDVAVTDLEKLKPFHWKVDFGAVFDKGGFDIVIGNPPYGKISDGIELEILKRLLKFGGDSEDKSSLFVERGGSLINESGCFGMIVPLNIARIERFYETRRFLIEKVGLLKIVDEGNPFRGEVELEMFSIFYGKDGKTEVAIESHKPIISPPANVPINVFRKYNYRFILYWDEIFERIVKGSSFGVIKVSQGVPRRAHYTSDGKYSCLSAIALDPYIFRVDKFQKDRRVSEDFIKDNNLSYQLEPSLVTAFSLGKTGKVTDLAFEVALKPRGLLPDGTSIFIEVSDKSISLKYLVMLLNSELINFFVCRYILSYGVRIFRNYLFEILPIKVLKSYTEIERLADILLFLKQYNYDNYKCKHEKNGDVNEIESFFTEISDCLIYEIYLKEDLKTKLFDSISDSNLPRVNYDEWLSLELKESLSNYEKKLKNDIEIKNLDVISKTYKKLESQEKIDNDIKIIRESELIKKIKKLIPPSQL